MPKLSVFLIVDSPLAEEKLNQVSLHQLALGEAIAFSKKHQASVTEVTFENLLEEIKRSGAEIVVIHDALRPLVHLSQFERTYAGLGEFDAVRPTMAFTETIKSLDSQNRLDQTIDREKVRRISTPEIIRTGAIDFAGKISTWLVPLVKSAKTTEVEADPESIRINSAEELRMLIALAQVADPAHK